MKMYVFTDGIVATLVAEGTPDEEGMRQLPHLKCEAEHECETIEDGIEWFRTWSRVILGGRLKVL